MSAIHEFVRSFAADLAVTIAYNPRDGVSRTRFDADLRRLINAVDRKLIGKHYNISPTRSSFIGCIEHENSNFHAHLKWKTPPMSKELCEASRIIHDAWVITVNKNCRATAHVSTIHDNDGWSAYVVKDQKGATDGLVMSR
jgi:hypothetical protein